MSLAARLHPRDALRLPRLLGLATAAYGCKELLQPAHLAKAAQLTDPPLATPPVRVLGAVLGIRDVACGLAMMAAPAGRPLRAAIAARAAFDTADCLAFTPFSGAAAANPWPARRKVAGITLGWAALCALSSRWAG